MPELPRARHTGPDTLHHLRGGTPAVPQAERRQQKGRGQRKANDRPGRPTREEQGIIRAMTTINNQDDFLEALRNNPQWRDAVRAQILGDDLMELPAKFDAFVEEQRTTHANLDARLDRIDTRLDRMDTRLDRMEGDTGTLKGDFARTRTIHPRCPEHRVRHGPGARPDPQIRRAEGNGGKRPSQGRGTKLQERRPGDRSYGRRGHPLHNLRSSPRGSARS